MPAANTATRVALAGVLLATGLVLFLTAIPGVFTVDEDNYLVNAAAVRRGQLFAPGTAGLPPSRELHYFMPLARVLDPVFSPACSDAPPLYGFLAWPFAGGWRGLMLLNLLGFLACGALVFLYTRIHAASAITPWMACGVYLLASASLEYAQGVWPHCFSAALCLGGVFLAQAGRRRLDAPAGRWAALLELGVAGLLLGLAAGVRYPNFVFALALLAALLVFARPRLPAAAAFGLGLALPLLASAYLNHLRWGSWSPISKPYGAYLEMGAIANLRLGWLASLLDGLRAFFARVVDFSIQYPVPIGVAPMPPSDVGAYLLLDVVKKAWLQSAPWLIIPLLGLVLVVLLIRRPGRLAAPAQEREILFLGICMAAILGLFTVAGANRVDGLCFNQRYFMDIMPLAVICYAWLAERHWARHPWLLGLGLAGGVGAVALILQGGPGTAWRQFIILKAPVLLACVYAGTWLAALRGRTRGFALLTGLCLGWAAAMHLGDDLRGMRAMRRAQAERLALATRVLPAAPMAVLAHHRYAQMLGPLQLSRDLVIADTWTDDAVDAPGLVAEFQRAGRRVFLIANEHSEEQFRRVTDPYRIRWFHRGRLGILEITGPRAMPGAAGETP